MLESLKKVRGYDFVDIGNEMSAYIPADKVADEIQAEVDEYYMPLPLDAEGVSIHVGDEMVQNDKRIGCVTGVGFNVEPRVWVLPHGKNVSISFVAKGIVHHKPRTVEDVLREFADEATDIDGRDDDEWLPLLAKYAAELRVMMGGDA